jgi:hypothetical protein
MSAGNGKNTSLIEFVTMLSIAVFLLFILIKFLYF